MFMRCDVSPASRSVFHLESHLVTMDGILDCVGTVYFVKEMERSYDIR